MRKAKIKSTPQVYARKFLQKPLKLSKDWSFFPMLTLFPFHLAQLLNNFRKHVNPVKSASDWGALID